jgi:hypothetical protein
MAYKQTINPNTLQIENNEQSFKFIIKDTNHYKYVSQLLLMLAFFTFGTTSSTISQQMIDPEIAV